ncbi:MAG TPA: DUF6510 family protein [Gaiellales bacterium]|jgi:hypothetical protein|nr:DUF6510 family protein [Gaiellales bacterium]
MQTSELKLDGNAVAGLLQELFAFEVTAATGTCAACGAVEPVGGLSVYVHAPGVVIRCAHCEAVMMRIVNANGRYLLDLRGTRCLETGT